MVTGDVVLAFDCSSCLGTEDEVLDGPRAGSPVDVFSGEARRYVVVGTATDEATPVGVVVRFVQRDELLVLTVYEIK